MALRRMNRLGQAVKRSSDAVTSTMAKGLSGGDTGSHSTATTTATDISETLSVMEEVSNSMPKTSTTITHSHTTPSSSSKHAVTDGSGSGSESPNSSYPASPSTQFLQTDVEPEDQVLDSPPTTPSQTSSSEELSKTFAPHPALPHNLLQERIRLQTEGLSSRSHTRSSSAWSSVAETSEAVTPLSVRSRSSSIRSTASSIFERFCGAPKKPATTTLSAEQKSSMGLFTPFSAKGAAGSLRHLAMGKRLWTVRLRTTTTVSNCDARGNIAGGVSSDSDEPEPHRDPVTSRRPTHARAASTSFIPPTVCMTHSSFQDASVLETERSRSNPSAPPPPPPTKTVPPPARSSHTPSIKPTHTHPSIPASWLNPAPSLSSSRKLTTQAGSSEKGTSRGLDPTLAALEKSCRLKCKVDCAMCGTTGYDFPKDRLARAICSRECRMALKSKDAGALDQGPVVATAVVL